MNIEKIRFWQILPTIIVAFITGYFFKWLTKDHSIPDADAAIWLSAFATISAIVIAFVLGARQANAIWKTSCEVDERSKDQRRTCLLAIATAAFAAMERLDGRYQNTHAERMRLRVMYHGDTFASLIEALAAIPIHELETAEASVALVGLKKNMVDAQREVDRLMAWKNKPDIEAAFAEGFSGIDLRAYKTCAESHYRNLVQALKMD